MNKRRRRSTLLASYDKISILLILNFIYARLIVLVNSFIYVRLKVYKVSDNKINKF